MSHKELEYNYNAELDNRRELSSGSVKYDVKVTCEDTEETLVETTYTVSKKQEEKLERMIKRFAEKRAKEYEHDIGEDHSGKKLEL